MMIDLEKRPVVSVIMPAYNAAFTIGCAIRSLIAQTYQDWELIVVNDCSTDRTAEVVGRFQDPRIVLISLPANVRSAAARNVGLTKARGKWFVALDADDAWDSRRLSTLMKRAGSENFVSDITVYVRPNDAGNPVPERVPGNPEECSVMQLTSYGDYFSSPGHKFGIFPIKEFLENVGGFPEDSSGGEWAFVYAKWFCAGFGGTLLLWPGVFYRSTGSHYSSGLSAIEEQLSTDRYLSEADVLPPDTRSLIAEGLVHIRRRLLVAALRERNWKAFLHYAGKHPRDAFYLPGSALQFVARRWSRQGFRKSRPAET